MKNIILTGMPAAGKSTIGVILAKTLAMNFIDTDLVIQENESMTLQKIIDEKGLEYFLLKEEETLLHLTAENSVIATGGSVIYSDAAMEHLQQNGTIFYLRASLKTIKKRLHNITTRGLVMRDNQTIEKIYYTRMALYEKYGTVIIDCDYLNPEDIVRIICDSLNQFL